MKALVLTVCLTLALSSMVGCASQKTLNEYRPLNNNWMPGRLMEREKNPMRIVGIGSMALYGGGRGGSAGSAIGGDAGAMGTAMSGGSLGQSVVGGIVGSIVGGISGVFYDKFGKPIDKDLYTVRVFNVNYNDSQIPYKSEWVVVRFDRKGYSYRVGDYIVLAKSKETVKGQDVYRGIDIFDVKPKEVYGYSYAQELAARARASGQNTQLPPQAE